MTDKLIALAKFTADYAANRGPSISGKVCQVSASTIKVTGIANFARIGELISVSTGNGEELAEITHIDRETTTAVPHQNKHSTISLGARATLRGLPAINPDITWLGRAIDPLGRAIDDLGPLTAGPKKMLVDRDPPQALDRNRVSEKITTGIKAIDVFMPICSGQRLGIFAGSGVGKSTLLAMLSAVPDASVVVLALVGERGREVREFLEDVLAQQRSRVVTVVATSDASPAIRRLAPKTALTVAEYFRARGARVLLMIDSITRFAHAQREHALASGELPVARGYPPSVFTEIARLLERSGPGPRGEGDITTFTTVLVDGDDHNDPVSDATRGIIDGHIVLDRRIAGMGRWPAIDILGSLSRLADKAWSKEQFNVARAARALVARFEDTRDLRLIGGYQPGTDPELDKAVTFTPKLYEFLQQRPNDTFSGDPFAVLTSLMPK